MDIGQWLFDMGRRHRESGVFDCCTFPADWCIANGFPDPMAAWRGKYSTEEEATAIIGNAGGLQWLFASCLSSIGLLPTGNASPGDIGVISIKGEEAGAIYTGERWSLVAEVRGLRFVALPPSAIAAVWGVHG